MVTTSIRRPDSRDEVVLFGQDGYVEAWNETQWVFQFVPQKWKAKVIPRSEAARVIAADNAHGKQSLAIGHPLLLATGTTVRDRMKQSNRSDLARNSCQRSCTQRLASPRKPCHTSWYAFL